MNTEELHAFWFPKPMTRDILGLHYFRAWLEIQRLERCGHGESGHCLRLNQMLDSYEERFKELSNG